MKHFITIILLVVFISGEKVFTQPIVWEHTGGPTGYRQTCVVALAINPSGHIFASLSTGTGSGLWRSTDGGNSWTRVIRIKFWFGLAINSSGHIFIGNPSGEGVYRSTDNGDTWTQINNGLTYPAVMSLAINSSGHIYAGMSFNAGNIFRSTDNGESWTQVHPGLPSTAIDAIAFNSSGHIFAGNRNGTIFRSMDNGENWDEVMTGITNKFVLALAINSNDHIFAGTWDETTGDGIFRSTDNGETWNQVNSGLPTRSIQSLVINSDDHVFAATYGWGVYRSTDNGKTWKDASSGLTYFDASSFAINSIGQIFLGTCLGGVFRTVGSTTRVDDKIDNPGSFVLYQNYPNPFNPATTIRYSLPESGRVQLLIYNELGRLVRRLVNEQQLAGERAIVWEGKSDRNEPVASGIYFYTLKVGDDILISKKMVIIK